MSSCALCNAPGLVLVKERLRDLASGMKVYRCDACGHTQLWPFPTPEEDRAFYDQNQQDRSRQKAIDLPALRVNQSFDTDRHVKTIQDRFPASCSVLDIGAGYGFFLEALQKVGYARVSGLEVSEERRNLALAHGTVPIAGHDVYAGPAVIGTYDVVTLFHVLEHVTDPFGFAEAVHRLILPGGTLIVEVPNVDDLLLANSPEYNDFYWIRAHLHYFNAKNLQHVLQTAGFQSVEIKFVQRYGLLNLANWLSYGRPQIDKPVFNIEPDYRASEAFYRDALERVGRSDAIMAFAQRP